MAENKTKPTKASVAGYLAAIANDVRRKDCESIAKLMTRVTKEKPVMWGPSIVGFGSYHYKYDSGREGDACLAGFSSGKGEITVYLAVDFAGKSELLGKLGKHRMGKSCLYIRKLEDVDAGVLEELVSRSTAEMKRRYP